MVFPGSKIETEAGKSCDWSTGHSLATVFSISALSVTVHTNVGIRNTLTRPNYTEPGG